MVATANDARITLYSGNFCPYCIRVKKELDRLDLTYDTVNADNDGRQGIIELSGQRAIPVMTIGDEVLVDSTHIIRELRKRYAS
ncbi:MAG: glutaredoxin family protein [Rubrobacteraceae bacterium]|jgi:glutaredoxin